MSNNQNLKIMYTTYNWLNSNTTVKLVSIRRGRISIGSIKEAMIYAQTQGLVYHDYAVELNCAGYYRELASLMESLGQTRVAARCFEKALDSAWVTSIVYAKSAGLSTKRILNPEYFYELALSGKISYLTREDLVRIATRNRLFRALSDSDMGSDYISMRALELEVEGILSDVKPY